MFTVRNSLGMYLTEDGKFVEDSSKACVYFSYRQADAHVNRLGFRYCIICLA